MKRIGVLLAAIMAGAVLAVLTVSASAVSPSEQQCTDSGGTYTHTQGVAQCTYTTTDPAGNSTNGHTFGATTTTTGQGNTSNKQTTTTACSGAGGSDNCPPGQFK